MALPAGLRKRGAVYYVQHKEGGTWRLKAVGSDLRQALARHRELRGSEQGTSGGVSFEALVERWLASQETRCRPASVRASRQRSRLLVRYFCGWAASAIDGAAVESYIRWRRDQDVSDVSVNADLTSLRQILRFGHLQAGVLPELPVRVRLLRTVKKHRRRTFNRADCVSLIETAHKMKRIKVELFIRIAVATGLRMDEILHLRWEDIDLADQRIDVRAKQWTERRWSRKTKRHEEREYAWAPKSHQERSVWIDARLVDQLRARRGDGWVFTGRRKDLRLTTISKDLREVFQWAGLYEKGSLAHTFRHSVATSLLQNGVDLETVRDWLGHQQITTTALYLHASDDRKRKAARQLKLA